MVWPIYKPPRGGPPSGPGWGGPAKGRAVDRKPKTDVAGNAGKWRTVEERKRLRAEKEARLEQVMETWGDVMLNSENDMARIAAGDKIYERLDGKVPQKNENLNKNVEMPFEEMVKQSVARSAPPKLPESSDSESPKSSESK